MKTIETLAVDIDDVVAMHASAFCEFSNSAFGTTLTVATYHEDWANIWGVDEAEAERRKQLFFVPEIIGAFEPVPEASDALLRLALSGKEIVGVTKRRATLEAVTADWISQHCPGIFAGVIHATYFDEAGTKVTRNKAEICQEIGAAYLIDDQLKSCLKVAELGIGGLWFGDYGWKQEIELPPQVTSVNNWKEVLVYFDERS